MAPIIIPPIKTPIAKPLRSPRKYPALLDPSCVAYYDFSRGPKLHDLSGQGNHGEIFGATFVAKGKYNTALSFDGIDDYVNVPLSVFNATDGSWEAWVKIIDSTGDVRIFSSTHSLGALYEFRTYATSETNLRFFMGDGIDTSISTDLEDYSYNTWIHICCTWQTTGANTTLKGYKNGTPVNSRTHNGTPATPNVDILIGRWKSKYSKVIISTFGIYKKALSANEIKNIYEVTS